MAEFKFPTITPSEMEYLRDLRCEIVMPFEPGCGHLAEVGMLFEFRHGEERKVALTKDGRDLMKWLDNFRSSGAHAKALYIGMTEAPPDTSPLRHRYECPSSVDISSQPV